MKLTSLWKSLQYMTDHAVYTVKHCALINETCKEGVSLATLMGITQLLDSQKKDIVAAVHALSLKRQYTIDYFFRRSLLERVQDLKEQGQKNPSFIPATWDETLGLFEKTCDLILERAEGLDTESSFIEAVSQLSFKTRFLKDFMANQDARIISHIEAHDALLANTKLPFVQGLLPAQGKKGRIIATTEQIEKLRAQAAAAQTTPPAPPGP